MSLTEKQMNETARQIVAEACGTNEAAKQIVMEAYQAEEERTGRKVRRLARKQGLAAKKSRKDGQWYIVDPNRNSLESSEHGMDAFEAKEWLEAEEIMTA